MKKFNYRPLFLLFAVLLHLLVFWFLAGLKIFSSQAPVESQEPQFMVVKLPPPTPPPPPPPGVAAGSMSMPSAMVAPVPTVASVAPITTMSPASFNLPAPQLPSLNNLPVMQTGSVAPGVGIGSGTGGIGQGAGQGTGAGFSITGMTIDQAEKLLVVVDHSGSMDKFYEAITESLKDKFKGALVVPTTNCKGEGTFANGKAVDAHSKFRDTPWGTEEAGNLYGGVYFGLLHAPDSTVVYIITDFEDGDSPEETVDMISTLRAMHIKLFICSVEKAPYGALADYAKESGGGYVLMSSSEAFASFKPGMKIQPVPDTNLAQDQKLVSPANPATGEGNRHDATDFLQGMDIPKNEEVLFVLPDTTPGISDTESAIYRANMKASYPNATIYYYNRSLAFRDADENNVIRQYPDNATFTNHFYTLSDAILQGLGNHPQVTAVYVLQTWIPAAMTEAQGGKLEKDAYDATIPPAVIDTMSSKGIKFYLAVLRDELSHPGWVKYAMNSGAYKAYKFGKPDPSGNSTYVPEN